MSACSWRSRAARGGVLRIARKLLPLIDRESRPALWVLVRIYSGCYPHSALRLRCLLEEDLVADFPELEILAVGMARMAWARL